MITVVGGTYREFCFEPIWNEVFGSGLRACHVIKSLDKEKETQIHFHTFADQETENYLRMLPFLNTHVITIRRSIHFDYDHPLGRPGFSPRLDLITKQSNNLSVEGENILYYGFIEGQASVKGQKVVYDPQSPANPIPFSHTKSKAGQLIYVINLMEARRMSGQIDLQEIIKFFFERENAFALILKMGPQGAKVITADGTTTTIPVYKTKNVWSIGSGDVFAAAFAYHWFKNADIINAATQASWVTACYCNSQGFTFEPILQNPDILPLTVNHFPTKQIYLAGPFFTFTQRWLVDQVRMALQGMKLNVFSPFHDVGHGVAKDVVPADIEALKNSAIVFAILDGLDSGTVFEVGYGIKQGIPIVGYVQNETSGSLKMMEGTGCILENDLTTAIYKCFWHLAENE